MEQDNDKDDKISDKCAAVLISIGGTTAAGAFMMTPTALCTAVFCSTGVAGGSFASWWQSMMPLVAKGSLFSYLQSIVMGGSGSMTILQSMIGLGAGSAGIVYLKRFCDYVDETDPDSAVGKSFDATLSAVTALVRTGEMIHAQCSASETCNAGKDKLMKAYNTAADLKKNAEERISNSENFAAGKAKAGEMIDSAAITASSFWAAAKEGVSVMTTRFGELIDELENENKRKKSI